MKYINLGILAHIDAGKTTLTEQMLYKSGALRSPGTIEKGNTQTDGMAVERERGISVRASSASLEHNGVRVNIIDTPGHIDFTGEAERALSVLDAAVLVVSAAEGIQSQTDIFWNALKTLRIPVILFINKIDRVGCEPESVYIALKREFSERIFAIGAFTSPGCRECAVCAPTYTDDDVLELCGLDDGLAAAFFNDPDIFAAETGGAPGLGSAPGGGGAPGLGFAPGGGTPDNAGFRAGRLTAAVAKLSRAGIAYPLLYGSAALGVGVGELLDAISECLPATELTPDGDACGMIYKIEHGGAAGKVAFIRLFGGVMRNRETVWLIRRGEYVTDSAGGFVAGGDMYGVAGGGDIAGGGSYDVAGGDTVDGGGSGGDIADGGIADGGVVPLQNKISQIRRLTGAKLADAGYFTGGDAAAVCGLANARAGDVVVAAAATEPINTSTIPPHGLNPALAARLQLREKLRLAEPLFSVKVFAETGDENKLLRAVSEFADEDPLLEYEWAPDERELILRVMGSIQLEILESLFLERYGLAVRFSPPTVIYKETPKGPGVGLEEYTMPKPCWAVVQLAVEPLPRGSGYVYESVIKAKTIPYRYQHHIAFSVPQALKQGLLNWEVTDIKVTLIGGEHHHVHTHPMDFFLATPIAVMKALQDAGTQLLEPLTLTKITAPENLAGRIIGDITSMRGSFGDPVMRGGNIHIEALLPVSESIGYPIRFASLTSGKGAMRTAFAGYRECPPGVGAAAKRRGVNPLDRMRWILYKRNALQ